VWGKGTFLYVSGERRKREAALPIVLAGRGKRRGLPPESHVRKRNLAGRVQGDRKRGVPSDPRSGGGKGRGLSPYQEN